MTEGKGGKVIEKCIIILIFCHCLDNYLVHFMAVSVQSLHKYPVCDVYAVSC